MINCDNKDCKECHPPQEEIVIAADCFIEDARADFDHQTESVRRWVVLRERSGARHTFYLPSDYGDGHSLPLIARCGGKWEVVLVSRGEKTEPEKVIEKLGTDLAIARGAIDGLKAELKISNDRVKISNDRAEELAKRFGQIRAVLDKSPVAW